MPSLKKAAALAGLLALAPMTAPGGERIRDPEDEPDPARMAVPAPKRAPAAGTRETVRDPEDVEDGAGPAATPAAARRPAFRGALTGYVYSQLAIDTRLNDGREHAADWRNLLYVKLAVEPSERIRAVAAGRFRHVTAVERNESDAPFLLFNGSRPRHFYEADLWEAHLDVFLPGKVDLRVGNQIFHWGSADVLSPTDVLNPVDARWGLLVEPDELKIPVFAVSATWRGPVNVSGAWIPFVVPMRAFLVGHDFGLLQPRAYFPLPDGRAVLADPLSDALQRLAFEGAVPARSFASSQGGVRLWGSRGGVDFGVSYFAGYEPYPSLTFDRELSRALAAALGRSPDLPRAAALALGAAQRAGAGEPVALASYQRRQVMGFDLTAPLGPLLFRLDAAYSPLQTVYVRDGDFVAPVRRPAVTYSAGIEYRHAEDFSILVQWFHLVTAIRPADELFLLQPNFQAVWFDVRWRLLDGDLELGVSGLGGVSQGDLVLTASVSCKLTSRLHLVAGAAIFAGSAEGPGGYFDGNDQVFLRLRVRI